MSANSFLAFYVNRSTYGAFQSMGFSPITSTATNISLSSLRLGLGCSLVYAYLCFGPCKRSTSWVSSSRILLIRPFLYCLADIVSSGTYSGSGQLWTRTSVSHGGVWGGVRESAINCDLYIGTIRSLFLVFVQIARNFSSFASPDSCNVTRYQD